MNSYVNTEVITALLINDSRYGIFPESPTQIHALLIPKLSENDHPSYWTLGKQASNVDLECFAST